MEIRDIERKVSKRENRGRAEENSKQRKYKSERGKLNTINGS